VSDVDVGRWSLAGILFFSGTLMACWAVLVWFWEGFLSLKWVEWIDLIDCNVYHWNGFAVVCFADFDGPVWPQVLFGVIEGRSQ